MCQNLIMPRVAIVECNPIQLNFNIPIVMNIYLNSVPNKESNKIGLRLNLSDNSSIIGAEKTSKLEILQESNYKNFYNILS